MKRAVLTDYGKLEIINGPALQARPYEAVVDIEVCGVCRTDKKAFLIGQKDLVLPRVLGHEIVGSISSLGESAAGFGIGDRVQVHPGEFCGACETCINGNDHLCSKMQIIGFHLDGGFSEQVAVPAALLTKVPDGLGSLAASLAEPLACSINIIKRLDIKGADIAIYGAGPLGVLSAQLARHFGAGRIAIVEPMAERRQAAQALCDLAIGYGPGTQGDLLEWTNGAGLGACLCCCPGNGAFSSAISVLAKRGRLGFFSGLTDADPIAASVLNAIHYRELTVVGSYGCSIADTRLALELLAGKDCGIGGAGHEVIGWDGLSGALSDLEPQKHVFTFFMPQIQGG
ncbi:MAG: alcohol dehydrogenase catalytic domain-containing protein [Eubacteriaceae bacterium]|nr:alcohol dehydrogenase catalytic domain-containing protein [Eubacteriaceae bacterium]